MREILFRGKRVDGEGWAEGDIHHNDTPYFPMVLIGQLVLSRDKHTNEISFDGYCLEEVDPETVGQYTGLTDKNGKRIFEGDIIKESHWLKRTFKVEFDEGRGGWYPFACGDGCGCCEDEVVAADWCEVIGNIHDNPELIAEVEG